MTDWVVVAVLSLFVLRLLYVISQFAWSLPRTAAFRRYSHAGYYYGPSVYFPPGAAIVFDLFESLASAASFLGIAKTKFQEVQEGSQQTCTGLEEKSTH